jgi:hypothetical protein
VRDVDIDLAVGTVFLKIQLNWDMTKFPDIVAKKILWN